MAKVVKACGSSVNDQRPQFLALLADTSSSPLVVEHQDRCSLFGVAYRQTLLATQGRELGLVNEADAAAEEQADLMYDVVAIIAILTSFCARLSGRRQAGRQQKKQTQLLAALEGT